MTALKAVFSVVNLKLLLITKVVASCVSLLLPYFSVLFVFKLQLLNKVGISNTYIFSNLDPSARKINAAKFRTGKVSVLLVTDVAARGIDIPQLDIVLNYNFPAKSKLFVHRVGKYWLSLIFLLAVNVLN
jgi:late competence protein required for DNA uptake (superfamily II DNA/RNA helicase)